VLEQKLLTACLQNRQAYDYLTNLRFFRESLTDQGRIILEEIEQYYNNDKKIGFCDKELLEEKLVRKYPKHEELFRGIIASFSEVSVQNLLSEAVEVYSESLRLELAGALAAGNSGEIERLIKEYQSLPELGVDSYELFNAPKVSELIQHTTGEARIKFLPTEINARIEGGALRQHHVVIFGRPEIGKSTFVQNLIRGFLLQKLKVLCIGNEDPARDWILRLVSCVTGLTKKQIMKNPDKAEEIAKSKNYENFYFADLSPGTLSDIKRLVEEHEPDVVVVDQLRNLRLKETNRVLQLEKLAMGMREIGKEYNTLAISITQAGDSADNKLILEMGDVDFSNTGIQATADLMIGIGANREHELTGSRFLSFPKNKIGGLKEPVRCLFNTKLARVE